MHKNKIFLFFILSSLLFFSCDEPNSNKVEDLGSVVILGDSIFALSGDIAKELKLLSNKEYSSFCISGAEMKGGQNSDIPEQYKRAKVEKKNINTVIFNGGGNDLLTSAQKCMTEANPDEENFNEVCAPYFISALQNVSDEIKKLLLEMKTDQVQHVIYLGYYKMTDPNYALLIDLGMTVVKKAFDEQQKHFASPLTLSFVDPRPQFESHEAEYILADQIHPSSEGSKTLAKLIWQVILDKNIEAAK